MRAPLHLRKYILKSLDCFGLAILGQLVSVDDHHQALLVAADDAALMREIIVHAHDRVASNGLGKTFDGQGVALFGEHRRP